MTIVIGLTGSIASGKSTIAGYFADEGAAVLDCDKVVAELYETELVDVFKKLFPEVILDNKISKDLVKKHIIPDSEKKQKLEAIIHPLVRKKAAKFIEKNNDSLVILEIQLLFEAEAQKSPEYGIDYTIVVIAPYKQRLQRAKKTRDITDDYFVKINAAQMPEDEKIKLADFVIDNSDGKDVKKQISIILDEIKYHSNVQN